MRWPSKVVVLLGICFLTSAPLIYAQNEDPSPPPARAVSPAATEEEVAQLRQEVAELKIAIQRLAEGSGKTTRGEDTAVPIVYFNARYNFYKGDGAPPDTFSIQRARFGLQGSYGKQLDYEFLFE